MLDKLAAFETRLEALDRQLMDPAVASDGRKVREVSREAAHVREIVEAGQDLKGLHEELAGAREVLTASDDDDFREMARQEIAELEERIEAAAQHLRLLLLPRDPYEGRPIMLEIRAGTGGDEAALFAGDLFRMYSRYAEQQGWRVEILSASEGEHGGYKEIISRVVGKGAYAKLKFESGAHRVQPRITHAPFRLAQETTLWA